MSGFTKTGAVQGKRVSSTEGVVGLETGGLRWGGEEGAGAQGDAQPGHHEEEVVGEPLTFSPAWILKDTPRTASGSSGRYLSPKSRNSICPLRGQGGWAAQVSGFQGA